MNSSLFSIFFLINIFQAISGGSIRIENDINNIIEKVAKEIVDYKNELNKYNRTLNYLRLHLLELNRTYVENITRMDVLLRNKIINYNNTVKECILTKYDRYAKSWKLNSIYNYKNCANMRDDLNKMNNSLREDETIIKWLSERVAKTIDVMIVNCKAFFANDSNDIKNCLLQDKQNAEFLRKFVQDGIREMSYIYGNKYNLISTADCDKIIIPITEGKLLLSEKVLTDTCIHPIGESNLKSFLKIFMN